MAMNNQLLAVVQHIESERGVSREIVVTAIEQALLLIEDDKVDAAVVSRMLEAGCRIYEDILDAYSDV